jgi:hypothetical protein
VLSLRRSSDPCRYNIDANYVFVIVSKVLKAVNSSKDPFLNNVNFPFGDVPRLTELANGFGSISNNVLWGTVAAGDGVVCHLSLSLSCLQWQVFRMHTPTVKETNKQVTSYFSRKGCVNNEIVCLQSRYFCFGLQAFCDSNCRFLSASAQMCSSTHDSTSYIATGVSQSIKRSRQLRAEGVPEDRLPLPWQFHIVLDEAYVSSGQELSPWRGKGLSEDKDVFNYYLSLHRQVIERSFGLLVQRWGILWRPLRVALVKVPVIITALLRLHNICVARFGKRSPSVPIDMEEITATPHSGRRDEPNVNVTWTDGTGGGGQGCRSDLLDNSKREHFTETIFRGGFTRPLHSVFSRVLRIEDLPHPVPPPH